MGVLHLYPHRSHSIITSLDSQASREPVSVFQSHPPPPSYLCCSYCLFYLTVSCFRPCCFLFANKSLLCNFCLYIQTHRNNSVVVFMALGGRRAGETTFEEEEADLVTVPGAHLTAEGRKKSILRLSDVLSP